MPKMPECPTGRSDCRFMGGSSGWRRGGYYPPIYDRDGNNTNPDRSKFRGRVTCQTCGSAWTFEQVGSGPRVYTPEGE